jgi:hypothetical protein
MVQLNQGQLGIVASWGISVCDGTPKNIEYNTLRMGKSHRDNLAPKWCTLEMNEEPHMSERHMD